MEKNGNLYRLDFKPEASKSDRAEMCALIENVGAMVSCKMSTERSGPFGLEYSHQIEYAQVTTLDGWESAAVHKVMADNPIFALSTLTQIG